MDGAGTAALQRPGVLTMSASARLLAAAALCLASLGLGWSSSLSLTGYMTPGMNLSTTYISPVTGDISTGFTYTPGWWVRGDPFGAARGHESDVRVVLVPAALVLAAAVRRPDERTWRAARIAVWALVAITILALSRGMLAAALSTAAAVLLAAPALGWRAKLGRFQVSVGG